MDKGHTWTNLEIFQSEFIFSITPDQLTFYFDLESIFRKGLFSKKNLKNHQLGNILHGSEMMRVLCESLFTFYVVQIAISQNKITF